MVFDPIGRDHQPDFSFLEVKRELIQEMGLMKMSNIDDIDDAVKNLIDWDRVEPVCQVSDEEKNFFMAWCGMHRQRTQPWILR